MAKPANTAFKQQRLKACQPILTPRVVVLAFLALGIVMLPLGIAMLLSNNAVVEVEARYDENCAVGAQRCAVQLEVPEGGMEGPVFFYYKLVNYYQNHRRYVQSRNDEQLRGNPPDTLSALANCAPLDVAVEGSDDPSNFYLPCGLIAASQFNDTFFMQPAASNANVTWARDAIAWPSDLNAKFENPPPGTPGVRLPAQPTDANKGPLNFRDEDFVVWMRVAGLPTFRKLYARLPEGLPAQGSGNSTYTVFVDNNYPVDSFNGEKWVVLSNTSWLGGKNPFLGYAYIATGALCLLLAGVFFVLSLTPLTRKMGDASLLSWNKEGGLGENQNPGLFEEDGYL